MHYYFNAIYLSKLKYNNKHSFDTINDANELAQLVAEALLLVKDDMFEAWLK